GRGACSPRPQHRLYSVGNWIRAAAGRGYRARHGAAVGAFGPQEFARDGGELPPVGAGLLGQGRRRTVARRRGAGRARDVDGSAAAVRRGTAAAEAVRRHCCRVDGRTITALLVNSRPAASCSSACTVVTPCAADSRTGAPVQCRVSGGDVTPSAPT